MSWLIVLMVLLFASFKNTSPKKQSVSVIIPAYNEEPTVGQVVSTALKLSYVDEVIVVDDGSTDRTTEEAEKAGATVIGHITNQGKGSAIKTGVKHSKGDILVFIDADISNLSTNKIDTMIRPILEGEADITKTKFARESGRVTELTAKPLLSFFFPELNFEQPLSGQFAGKRSALNKIKFEEDYGVDVGIVLDADVHGIKIVEVDIGEIDHDMSPLANLNKMANEVVRTIIDRAVNYGRVTMMDTLGNYIRMAIMSLSLVILGLFMLFFVPAIPLIVAGLVVAIGAVLTIYYIIQIIRKSVPILRKSDTRISLRSFINMHFPVIISGLILVLMLSTFLSATTFSDGRVSVELTSRNLVYSSDNYHDTISVRGPYTIEASPDNETDVVRIPQDALRTMEMTANDTMIIGGEKYLVNTSRDGEGDTFRLPDEVIDSLDVTVGDVIANSRITSIFEKVVVIHNIKFTELKEKLEGNVEFSVNQIAENATFFNLTMDNESVLSSVGIFDNDSSYSISLDDEVVCSFNHEDIENGTYEFDNGVHNGTIEFKDRNNTSIRHFMTSDRDSFVHLYSL